MERAPIGRLIDRKFLAGLAPYLVAGGVYITVGVFVPEALLSWVEGIGFVLLAVWGIPALVRFLRG
ncbi:MAG: hypothetical protein HYS09_02215 [Chloroflexi bacterium]|nr:hypothetical protein [Chloroflexota bacterium]